MTANPAPFTATCYPTAVWLMMVAGLLLTFPGPIYCLPC